MAVIYSAMKIHEKEKNYARRWEGSTVADPGFPRRGTNLKDESTNLLFGQIFVGNCMKIVVDREGVARS